jgi:hypothetical protein
MEGMDDCVTILGPKLATHVLLSMYLETKMLRKYS